MRRSIYLFTVAMLAVSSALAKAPTSKEGMQAVDTSAGSLTDTRSLFQVDLDRNVSVDVSSQPVELAFNQMSAILGIEWGYAQGVDKTMPITLMTSGTVRDVLKAVGKASNLRFEAGGPTQLRVVKARSASPKKKPLPPSGAPK